MLSDFHFNQIEKANQQLLQSWNILTKLRSNGELGEVSRLIKAEMNYLQSLQLVINAVDDAIQDAQVRKNGRY